MLVRVTFSVLLVGACISGIGAIFWQQELKYALPTPIPADFIPVPLGTSIEISHPLIPDGPVFLHFFNPDCPCSKFNLSHLKFLRPKIEAQMTFVAIIPHFADEKAARKQLGEGTRIITDTSGSLAGACGIYATPQAVILDAQHTLYFKGNYNQSRYCTKKETSYAEMALGYFSAGKPAPFFDALATTPFGCSTDPQTETFTLWQP
jgi:hypothetical protein